MSNQYINYLNSVADTITYYPLLVALPIGIICNVFSFYIYTRPNLNKKTNTGFLYASLCIANLIFMLYFVLVFQSNSLFNYTVTLPCGVMSYLLRIAFCFAPWMQVIISFDRFIVVVYPLKKKFMSKKVQSQNLDSLLAAADQDSAAMNVFVDVLDGLRIAATDVHQISKTILENQD